MRVDPDTKDVNLLRAAGVRSQRVDGGGEALGDRGRQRGGRVVVAQIADGVERQWLGEAVPGPVKLDLDVSRPPRKPARPWWVMRMSSRLTDAPAVAVRPDNASTLAGEAASGSPHRQGVRIGLTVLASPYDKAPVLLALEHRLRVQGARRSPVSASSHRRGRCAVKPPASTP